MSTGGVDEYYERYRTVAHWRLYQDLMAGKPGDVDRKATQWRTIQTTLSALARDLRADLDGLRSSWNGGEDSAAAAYQRLMERLAERVDVCAADAGAMYRGLNAMSGMLAEKQYVAESAPPESGEYAFNGLLGPSLGRRPANSSATALHERLARLVADLAAEYSVIVHTVWYGPRPEDAPPAAEAGFGAGTDQLLSRAASGAARVASRLLPRPPVPTLAGPGPLRASPRRLVTDRSGGASESNSSARMPMVPMAPMMGAVAQGQQANVPGIIGRRPDWDDEESLWVAEERDARASALDEPSPHIIDPSTLA